MLSTFCLGAFTAIFTLVAMTIFLQSAVVTNPQMTFSTFCVHLAISISSASTPTNFLSLARIDPSPKPSGWRVEG